MQLKLNYQQQGHLSINIIELELRSNSDKGTVETPVVKKTDTTRSQRKLNQLQERLTVQLLIMAILATITCQSRETTFSSSIY